MRGPDPDDPEAGELDRQQKTIMRMVEKMGEMGTNNSIGHDKWTTPLLMSLLISFILGGIALTMSFAALKQEVTDQNTRLERLEKLIEPRYRGAP
jgi:hypothetical protein